MSKDSETKSPIARSFDYDHTDDKGVIHSVQDVEPLLDMNKREINGDSMYGTEGGPLGMRKVASIPLIIIEKWKAELGVDVMNKDHMPKVKQLLNDPEYAYLRTHNSRILQVSLATYSDLKTSVANYLNRDDLTTVIPDFITLTENRLNRNLRVRTNLVRAETTTSANTSFYNLPSDLIELRNITYDTTSSSYALDYLSPESLSREYGVYTSGMPRAYTNLGKDIKLGPTPDAAYTININYFKKLETLSDANPTNLILSEFPELYLFSACLEGSIFLNDTEQMQRFMALYQQTLDDVKAAEDAARYSGTSMTMTVQGDPGAMVRRGAYG